MTSESRPPMTAAECSTCGGDPSPAALMAAADVTVRHFDFVKVDGRGRSIEVAISPTGRSVQVHVDGEPWAAAGDTP